MPHAIIGFYENVEKFHEELAPDRYRNILGAKETYMLAVDLEEKINLLIDNLRSLEERPAILVISHDREVLRHAESFHRVENGTVVPSAATVVGAPARGVAAS